jgi:hypothetical protein
MPRPGIGAHRCPIVVVIVIGVIIAIIVIIASRMV